jgi:hypothetical protein
LRLTVQRDVAGGGLVPAGGDADQRLMDLFLVQAHGIEVGAMRRAGWPLGHIAAGQFGFINTLVRGHGGLPGNFVRFGIKKPLAGHKSD